MTEQRASANASTLPVHSAPQGLAMPHKDATTSPIMRLYREWEDLRATLDHAPEDEWVPADYRLSEIEDEITAIPSQSAQDIAAKLAVWTAWNTFNLPEDSHPLWGDIRRLVKKG